MFMSDDLRYILQVRGERNVSEEQSGEKLGV